MGEFGGKKNRDFVFNFLRKKIVIFGENGDFPRKMSDFFRNFFFSMSIFFPSGVEIFLGYSFDVKFRARSLGKVFGVIPLS